MSDQRGAGEDEMESEPLYARLVIETMDIGGDPDEAVAFLTAWLKRAIAVAPFHVEGAGVDVMVRMERLDV